MGAIALGVASLFLGETLIPQPLEQSWVLIALALISQVCGQSLIAFALAHLSPAFSSVGLLLQPALATLLGWIYFNEALVGSQWIGIVFVLGGIYWARISSQNQGPPLAKS